MLKNNKLVIFFLLYFNLIIILNINSLILNNDHFNYLVSYHKNANSFFEYYEFKKNYLSNCNYKDCKLLFKNADVDYFLNYGFFVLSSYFTDFFNNGINSNNIVSKIILGQFFLFSSVAIVLGIKLENNKFFLVFIFSIFFFFIFFKYKLYFIPFHILSLVIFLIILFRDKVNLNKLLIYLFIGIIIFFLSWFFIKVTNLNIFRPTCIFYIFFLSSLILNQHKKSISEFFLILLCSLSNLYLSSFFILINIILSLLNKNNIKYIILKIIYFLIIKFYIFFNFKSFNFEINLISFFYNFILNNLYSIFFIIFIILVFAYFLFKTKFITLSKENFFYYIIFYLGLAYLILLKLIEKNYIGTELLFLLSIKIYFVAPTVAIFAIFLIKKEFFDKIEKNMKGNLKNFNSGTLSLVAFTNVIIILLYGFFFHYQSFSFNKLDEKLNFFMKDKNLYKTYIYNDLSFQWYLLNKKNN